MIDIYLVPKATKVNAKGDGAPVDLIGRTNAVLLLTLNIIGIVEQESLDLSVYGSTNGESWTEKPLASFPQKFDRGEYPLLLDLGAHPDIKVLRAHWDVARWGRGEPTPSFEFSLRVREVPADVMASTALTEAIRA